MDVSVIIPVYNKEDFIARSIDSVLKQSYQDFELIIVDDGSTDNSIRVAKTFSDSRIAFLHQANAGPGAARNLGIRNSHGEFIAFLDADDEWLPNYLSESLNLLKLNPTSVAVVSGYLEYPKAISTELLWKKRGITNAAIETSSQDSPIQIVYRLAYMSSWSTVTRKETLQRWGGFYSQGRCTYAEDAFLWLKILLNENIFFNTRPLVRFHREASDLSRKNSGPHPVEPFLERPDLIRSNCPSKLSELLEQVLAIRAFKTTCVLGYWGQWRQAARLFSTFAKLKYWNLPYFFPAMICSTLIGSSLGRIFRHLLDLNQKMNPLMQNRSFSPNTNRGAI